MDAEQVTDPNRNLNFTKTFVLLFALLVPLLVVSELINQKVFFRQKATVGNPSFSFNPAELTVNPGQEFVVEAKINTAGQQTSGASIKVVYDQNIFEALEIVPGKDLSQMPPMFPTVLQKKIDHPNGKVYLDAGVEVANPQYYAGEGIFGKIKFRVKPEATTGNKTVAFFLNNPGNPAALGDCDIIGSGEKASQDLLAEVNNLTVTVSSQTTPTNTPIPATPTPSGTQPTSTPPPSEPTPTLTPTEPPVEPTTPPGQPTATQPPAPTTPPGQPTNTPPPPSPTTKPPTSTPKPTLPPTAPDLTADISGPNGQKDNLVDIYDFNIIMIHWGETQNIGQYDISGPQNLPDGKIDFYDLIKVLVFWSP